MRLFDDIHGIYKTTFLYPICTFFRTKVNFKIDLSAEKPFIFLGSGTGQGAYCLVASGSSDRTVRVWDVRAKKPQVFLFRYTVSYKINTPSDLN